MCIAQNNCFLKLRIYYTKRETQICSDCGIVCLVCRLVVSCVCFEGTSSFLTFHICRDDAAIAKIGATMTTLHNQQPEHIDALA